MAVTWNPETFFEKASRGSFAAKAARADVFKNTCEIFQAGAYETVSGKTVELNSSPMLEGTVVYDASVTIPVADALSDPPMTGVANIGCLELGRELQEKGYDPVNQIVGYLLSGDPTYITSHNNARYLILRLERDELIEELVRFYVEKH